MFFVEGFFDFDNRFKELSNHGDPLEKLNKIMNWEIFRPILNEAFAKTAKGPGGRPPYDYVLMLKILFIQRLYNLSDSQTEYQIKDRLSFMRFLGLNISSQIPDEKTIWSFREHLTKVNAVENLFDKLNQELEKVGLIPKKGSIVDATFVHAPKQRNTREENAQVKEGIVPEEWKQNENKLRQKDCDARWAKKNQQTYYGYKNHIKCDSTTKIITNYVVSSANIHDGKKLESLLSKSENGDFLSGDCAYRIDGLAELLKKYGLMDLIHHRAYSNHPLSDALKELNRLKSKIRSGVEHIFGFINGVMKGNRIRCIGIKRTESIVGLSNILYNIFRSGQFGLRMS